MKRYLIPILAILVLASGLLGGCNQSQEPSTTLADKASWIEEQVIDHLYDYLMDKAEQLQGIYAQVEKTTVEWQFQGVINEVNREWLDELKPGKPLGELYTTSGGMHTWAGALKKIVMYQGDGLWSVSIGDKEWQVNERTGEVTAQNEGAVGLLKTITLKTYHNSKYGYYVDYPPSWTIHEEDNKNVLIFTGSPEEVKAFFFIGVIEEEELATYKGLQGYIEATLRSLKSQYHEFEVTEATPTRIHYTYMLSEHVPKHEARRYFVEHGSKVYDVVCSAELTGFKEWVGSSLYDPFDSFRFQP